MALQTGIEPVSAVPETAILSIRLLEQLFVTQVLYLIGFSLVSLVVVQDPEKSDYLRDRLILLHR